MTSAFPVYNGRNPLDSAELYRGVQYAPQGRKEGRRVGVLLIPRVSTFPIGKTMSSGSMQQDVAFGK